MRNEWNRRRFVGRPGPLAVEALAGRGCAAGAEGADGVPQELGEACDVAGVQRQFLPLADHDLQHDVGQERELGTEPDRRLRWATWSGSVVITKPASAPPPAPHAKEPDSHGT
ncbi:hypothetical protein a10_01575 [Streptomyces acidiscabies]|nr:hypothetical protein a10_01575 [Streptomyces acidiscabies]GAV37724.1 hypothetical protein Saa2_00598 [Streptomyces acidiscabies]